MILVALTAWDWRTHRRPDVFPIALAGVPLYHLSVFGFYRFLFWRDFAAWFIGLPPS